MNDNNFSNKKNITPPLPPAAGYAFLAFFIIMIVLIFICIKNGSTENAIMCFGLLFLVTGLVGFFFPKPSFDKAPVLLFPLVGAGAFVIPLLMKFGIMEFTGKLLAILLSVFCLIFGAGMVIISRVNHKRKLERYVPVTAVCRDLDMHISRSKNGHRTKTYAPKWEYYYDGRTIEVQGNTYTNIDVPEIGKEYDILIDPDCPESFYRSSKGMLLFYTLFGGGWAFAGLICLVIFSIVL